MRQLCRGMTGSRAYGLTQVETFPNKSQKRPYLRSERQQDRLLHQDDQRGEAEAGGWGRVSVIAGTNFGQNIRDLGRFFEQVEVWGILVGRDDSGGSNFGLALTSWSFDRFKNIPVFQQVFAVIFLAGDLLEVGVVLQELWLGGLLLKQWQCKLNRCLFCTFHVSRSTRTKQTTLS